MKYSHVIWDGNVSLFGGLYVLVSFFKRLLVDYILFDGINTFRYVSGCKLWIG